MEQASADMARLLPVVLRSFPAPEGFSSSMFEKARDLTQPPSAQAGRYRRMWAMCCGFSWARSSSFCWWPAQTSQIYCWCGSKDAGRSLRFALPWARAGDVSRGSYCSRASSSGLRAACSAWCWPTARCAFWWRWRRPAYRVSTKSASIFRCCSLPLR